MKNVTDHVSAKEIVASEMNAFRGRLLSIIETGNLPPKQERALKILIKQHSYQTQAVIMELVDALDVDEQTFRYITRKLDVENVYS